MMTRKKNDCPVKRFLYPAILLLFVTTVVRGAWTESTPLARKTGFDYVAAAWSSSTTCVIVGNGATSGAIQRTTNSGSSWSDVTQASQPYLLSDIAQFPFPSKSYHVVTGSNSVGSPTAGYVFTSPDGITFSDGKQVSNMGLNGVAIGSNGVAYVVGLGGKIYNSSVSSIFTNWKEITPKVNSQTELTAVASFDGKRVIAVGLNNIVLTSSNAGQTWASQNLGAVSSTTDAVGLRCISSFSSLFSMTAGTSSLLYKTSDGGIKWTSISSGLPTTQSSYEFKFHAISVVSLTVAFISSYTGLIFRTSNAGQTWSTVFTSGSVITSLAMYSSDIGVAGTGRNTGKFYFRYPDPTASPTAAPTFNPSQVPTANPTRDPTAVPTASPTREPTSQPTSRPTAYKAPTGLPTGQPTGSPTGFTSITPYVWSTVQEPAAPGIKYFYNTILSAAWSSASTVVAVGFVQTASSGLILRSTTGGLSWTLLSVAGSATSLSFNDVATYTAAGKTYFIAVANTGLIYLSSDGGARFAAAKTVRGSLTGAAIDRAGNAFAVGSGNIGNVGRNSTVFYSPLSSAYTMWTPVSPNSYPNFNAITCLTGVTGSAVAVGDSGRIYVGTKLNSGTPFWSFGSPFPTTSNLYCVASYGNFVVAGGGNAAIVVSRDGGSTWKSVSVPALQGSVIQFHALTVLTEAVAYLSAINGVIVKTVNAGKSFTLETSLPVNDGNLNALSMYNSLIGVAFDNGGNSYVKQSAPTSMPSYSPNFVSSRPTSTPTRSPSPAPTNTPTVPPTSTPTRSPTVGPTAVPTTATPSFRPTPAPTGKPSTAQPSSQPTSHPTSPSGQPTSSPTGQPSSRPTGRPSGQPTQTPTNLVYLKIAVNLFQRLEGIGYVPFISNPANAVQFMNTVANMIKHPSREISITYYFGQNQTPTFAPSPAPTVRPTPAPTSTPTVPRTMRPSSSPTRSPSIAPSPTPTLSSKPSTSTPSSRRRLSHLEAEEQEQEEEEQEEQESELLFDADSEDVMGIHLDSVFSMNANSVGINYTVAFIIQKYGFKDPVVATNSIYSRLTSSVTSGAFDTALKSTGMLPNVASKSIILASPMEINILHNSFKPTPAPTNVPKKDALALLQPAANDLKLSLKNTLILIVVLSVSGFICCLVLLCIIFSGKSREFLFCFAMDKKSNNNKKSKYDADDDDDEEDDKKKEKKNWFSRKRAGSLADSEADAQTFREQPKSTPLKKNTVTSGYDEKNEQTKKSETKWAKEAVALEKEQRLMSQFKSKNSGTDKDKDTGREKERDNSETWSVGSDKHYPNPFTKKGAGYGNKVKSDMHKDSEDEAPYDRTYADRSDDVIPKKQNFNAGKYGFKSRARTPVESDDEGEKDGEVHAHAWEKKSKIQAKTLRQPVKHADSDEESADDATRKPAYTFPKASRAGGGGGSVAGSESGVETAGYTGYGSEMATGMSTPTRSDTTPPASRDPLNPFLVPKVDAYRRRAHGSGAGSSLGVGAGAGGGSGGGAGSGYNAGAGEEESMSEILARMKLKTHASDAGGSGGGSSGGERRGDRGGGAESGEETVHSRGKRLEYKNPYEIHRHDPPPKYSEDEDDMSSILSKYKNKNKENNSFH